MAEMGQRRSARISALEASKGNQVSGDPGSEEKYIDKAKQIVVAGQSLEMFGRKKRKTRRVDDVVVNSVAIDFEQELDSTEDQPNDFGQPSSAPSAPLKLHRRAYEIIIDILQKRDKMNVFAQPVDPEEVEDYYDLIEEPMDFGTIKSKIRDGKYNTLKEFEYDVGLVSGNAILFNGPSTSYSKLGRAIDKLATKLFDGVKADPENYEAVLSNLRPRPGRRPKSHSTYGIPNHMNDNVALIETGTFSASYEEECRRISRPSTEFRSPSECLASVVYESSKQLVNSNTGISYTESLMRFVKDLGPVAQRIARQKLTEFQIQGPNSQIGSTYAQGRPNPRNSITNFPSQDFVNTYRSQTASDPSRSSINILPSQTTLNNFSSLPTLSNAPNEVINVAPSQNLVFNFSGLNTVLANTGRQLDSRGAFRGETSHQNHSSELQMGSGIPISSNGYYSSANSDSREITRPGSNYQVSPVPRWTHPGPVMQPSGIEQTQTKAASLPTYGGSTALLNQIMGWNRSDMVSSSFGGQNLPATGPGTVNSVEPNSFLSWRQANMGSSSSNRDMGPPDLVYGTSSNWNQPNSTSLILGKENQGMGASGVNFEINTTHGGRATVPAHVSVPTPGLPRNQQNMAPGQDFIDTSYFWRHQTEVNSFDQNGSFQSEEPELAPVPETLLVGQMGFCGMGSTNAAYQTGLSNLASIDGLQQPDLALQL